jgi:hypothetical protein
MPAYTECWSLYKHKSNDYEKQIGSERIKESDNYLRSPFNDFGFMATVDFNLKKQKLTPIIDGEFEQLNVPVMKFTRQKVLDLTGTSFMN